ncbi:MAG: hypothetical protein ACRD1V_11920 [Vicinamibacterales bacterium]
MTIRTLSRLIFAAYFLEAGLFLAVAPWSAFWEHNRFVESRPAFSHVLNTPYARGAVTGIGLITAIAGLGELGALFASRTRRREAHQQQAPE